MIDDKDYLWRDFPKTASEFEARFATAEDCRDYWQTVAHQVDANVSGLCRAPHRIVDRFNGEVQKRATEFDQRAK
jgi:hypothetical protein